MDHNGDGRISEEEFKLMLEHREAAAVFIYLRSAPISWLGRFA